MPIYTHHSIMLVLHHLDRGRGRWQWFCLFIVDTAALPPARSKAGVSGVKTACIGWATGGGVGVKVSSVTVVVGIDASSSAHCIVALMHVRATA